MRTSSQISPFEKDPKSSSNTILNVFVRTKAKNTSFYSIRENRLQIDIAAAPEKGKANKALIRFLATTLSKRQSEIELIQGQTSKYKRLRISNLTPEQAKTFFT